MSSLSHRSDTVWSCLKRRQQPKSASRHDHYIPDVCRELGVPCINLLGLMRRERWVL
jgi:hypothetical protein